MESVALLLCLLHALAGGEILCFVKRVAEALACLSHLFLYLLVVLCYLVLYQHVCAVALLRVAVVDERVVESVHVSACLPYRWVHENGGVDAHDVLVQQHHALPPILLDVVLQFHTVLSVVVNGSQSIIDLAAWEYEAILLAVRYYFLKNVFLCHNNMYNFEISGAKVMYVERKTKENNTIFAKFVSFYYFCA